VNLNTHIEQFMRFLKEERLDRMILVGATPLGNAASEFSAHYHSEKYCQESQNPLIRREAENMRTQCEITCRHRLDDMHQYYNRKAALIQNFQGSKC
jgi:hypothetical protein